jgi:hypothetical protein
MARDLSVAIAVCFLAISAPALVQAQSFGACGSNICSSSGANVGIGTTTPATILDTVGTIRSTAQTTPTSGAGLEMVYTGGTGYLTSYDRSGSAYKPLQIAGSGIYLMQGNVGIGTTSPTKSLTLSQKNTTDGFQFTGQSISGMGSGTGFLVALGYNATNNKQFWRGDVDYAGNASSSFNRDVTVNGLSYISSVLGDGSGPAPIGLGTASGSKTEIGFDSSLTQPASQLWVNGNITIGNGWKANAGPTNGLLVQGNVGIGTTTPVHMLQVAGTIGAEEVIVSSTGADYVFTSDYRLSPLSEVATYIEQNHHLSDIPSAKEVQAKGVSLGDMQTKLLAKVEELTLHMIQMDQENRELKERLARLEASGMR